MPLRALRKSQTLTGYGQHTVRRAQAVLKGAGAGDGDYPWKKCVDYINAFISKRGPIGHQEYRGYIAALRDSIGVAPGAVIRIGEKVGSLEGGHDCAPCRGVDHPGGRS